MLVSVCVPSYNRPTELRRLLESIDPADESAVEVVVCEDNSPRRQAIKEAVMGFAQKTRLVVRYIENRENLGFDRNLKELVRQARGQWVLFMGDDDVFVPGALDKLIGFLNIHPDLGYVLRSYLAVHRSGRIEKFRYYDGNRFFGPGSAAYLELFRKSVFISGFTIKREMALPYLIDDFDGTLIFQLYLMAEVVMHCQSAYFDEPLTQQYEKELAPSFGSAASERALYTPGSVTVANSLNFLKGFFKITGYLDKKYGLSSTATITKDMSKYAYPILAIQRKRGPVVFGRYIRELNRLGLNCTVYYYIYSVALMIFGERICNEVIRVVKSILRKTPKL